MPANFWVACGGLLAAVGVAAGAIGSHVLKDVAKLEPAALDTYEIAVRYQMYHSLALVLLGLLAARGDSRLWTAAGVAFGLGILLFSGGIYGWLATGLKPFVAVVPVGGTLWIVGWLLLAAGAARSRRGTV